MQSRPGRSGLIPLRLAIFCVAAAVVPGGLRWISRPSAAFVPATSALPRADCTLRFVGSSSIARWAGLDRALAPWFVDNRGRGGALIGDIARQLDADTAGAAPRAIILYAGDNDLAAGATSQGVVAGLGDLVARKRQRFGATPLFIISLKPSPARWDERAAQQQVNAALRALAASSADLRFVDIVPSFVAGDRLKPLFDADGVHLDAAGYRLWTDAIRTALRTGLPAPALARCGSPGDGA